MKLKDTEEEERDKKVVLCKNDLWKMKGDVAYDLEGELCETDSEYAYDHDEYKRDFNSDSDSVYTTETEYPVPEYTDRESPEELIAEPGFGRMLGLRRSASEIDRDVAISDALEAGDYDRVAELEKEYGSSDWTESLTQRTKDYTPEQIDAMLDPEVSEGSTNVLQDIFEGFDVEPSKEDASYGSLLNKGGRVKKKKSKKKPNKMTKVYSNKTRKPTRV